MSFETHQGGDLHGNPLPLGFWRRPDGVLEPLTRSHLLGSITLHASLLSANTAPGAGPALAVNGDTARLEVTCPGEFSVVIEGRRDGGAWFPLTVFDASYDMDAKIEAAGLYRVDIGPVDEIRANRTAGTAALTVR